MTNEELLHNIEYLREKADVSYEEAAALLERFDGNVMRVLVELERQGRVFTGATEGEPKAEHAAPPPRQESQAREKATSFINRAFQHHLVVESGKGEEKRTIADLSVPFVVGASIAAPYLAVASAAIAFGCGYRVRIKKNKPVNVVPDSVDAFVDQTVSNIRRTVSSVSETVRNATGGEPPKKDPDDHDDEGGEITVE